MPPPDVQQPRPRLLLIDDDPISREVLSMLLEMHGYPVRCAESGEEALGVIESERPEVILTDSQMPGLSGVALIRILRARTGARIVVISGSAVSEAIEQAADGFLLKPVQPEALDALLAADPLPSDYLEVVSGSVLDSVSAAGDDELVAHELVIDPLVLGKLQAIMPRAAVREIYEAVSVDLKIRLAALADAMRADDSAEVARIAHTIKGGCSMVGVTIVIQAASRLEFSNLNGTWPSELAQLHSAQDRLERILTCEFPS